MKTKFFIIALVLVSFMNCQTKKDKKTDAENVGESQQTEAIQDTPDAAHNSENSLDWAGLYKGEFPCADCPGIDISLQLKDDETYKMTYSYQERNTDIKEKGTFKWNDEGSNITLFANDSTKSGSFKVGENKLIKLDNQGQPIKGKMADKFILKKDL